MSLQAFAAWLRSTSLSTAIQTTDWVIPLVQSIHILMIGVVFVAILMVALRLQGWVRGDQPMQQVWKRFAPFLWGGLAVLLLTGVVMVIGEPERELLSFSFRAKMLLLAIGIAGAVTFGRNVRASTTHRPVAETAAEFSPALRAGALATLVLWIVIIFLGRAIAYDTSVWGSWSPMQ